MPEQHLCAKCAEEDPELTRKPRPVVNERRPYWCATHRRGELVRQGKVKRASQIERTYDISAEDAYELLLLQGGRCWLCQKATGATKSLAVDHDHATNEVRGRLCGPCNQFIGRLGDDPAAAQRLVGYLTGDTPYRRLRALQTLAAAPAQRGQDLQIHSVFEQGGELYAWWQRLPEADQWYRTLVRLDDGTWTTIRPENVFPRPDVEPRVETPGECGSCHALPDQPHTEYCNG